MSQNDHSRLIRPHKDAPDEQLEMSEPLGVTTLVSMTSKRLSRYSLWVRRIKLENDEIGVIRQVVGRAICKVGRVGTS